MTENKDIPQFVACGLEMGNCGYQIPYDMAEHERIIRADAIDELVEMLTNDWGLDIILTQSNKEKLKRFIASNAEQLKEQNK